MRKEQEQDDMLQADPKSQSVLLYDKNGPDRWLVGAFFRSLEKDAVVEEATEFSELKKGVEGGNVGLVVVSDDQSDECRFWLKHLVESQSAPVVVLVDQAQEDLAELLGEGPVAMVSKGSMSRDDLFQAVESAIGKWRAIQRGETHREALDRFANRDLLTGLPNRRSVLAKLDESLGRARRYGEYLSVLLLDVDSMGAINTEHGRGFGDGILVRIATTLERRTRDVDIKGRYGGDEFIVVFPHTDLHSARIAAERLCGQIEDLGAARSTTEQVSLSASGGLAAYEAGDDVGTLTYRAEFNLCKAKESGRNRIC
jgi:diguanylate cyclase (GGDEF)-like protein